MNIFIAILFLTISASLEAKPYVPEVALRDKQIMLSRIVRRYCSEDFLQPPNVSFHEITSLWPLENVDVYIDSRSVTPCVQLSTKFLDASPQGHQSLSAVQEFMLECARRRHISSHVAQYKMFDELAFRSQLYNLLPCVVTLGGVRLIAKGFERAGRTTALMGSFGSLACLTAQCAFQFSAHRAMHTGEEHIIKTLCAELSPALLAEIRTGYQGLYPASNCSFWEVDHVALVKKTIAARLSAGHNTAS